MKKIYKNISIICASIILVGCGGSGGSSSSSSSTAQSQNSSEKPQLIDSPIVGAKYINENGQEGKTIANGEFTHEGGSVAFYVGKIKIGTISSLSSDNRVFLQDILNLNRENKDDTKLLASAQFLQSLDTNPDTDSIEIGSNYEKFDKDIYENQELKDLDVLSALADANIEAKDLSDVKTHLDNSIKRYIKRDQDSSAPFIKNMSPQDNSREVLTNEDIVIEFSENISKDSVLRSNIVLRDNNGNVIQTSKKVLNNKLIIKPKSKLSLSQQYSVQLDQNIQDYAGNSLVSDQRFTFSTIEENDKTAPSILSTSILGNENNIKLLEPLVLNFSEKMDDNTINSNNITLVKKLNNESIPLNIKYNGNKLVTITPRKVLDANTQYTLKISGNLKDLNNNFFNSMELNFRTNDSFSFNGFEYKVISSPITGRTWLDRNLGAQKVCDSKADEKCYGDYYQWGRRTNNHEKASSKVFDASLNPLKKDMLSNGKFALWADDWRRSKNDDLWKGDNAINAVCPLGYKVPSIDELLIETKYVNELQYPNQKVDGQYTNLTNFLKLPNNGLRKYKTRDGSLESRAYSGQIWSSSTTDKGLSYSLNYFPGGIWKTASARSYGYGVRCIKDYTDTTKPTISATTPANNATNVPLNADLTVTFSKPFISSPSRKNILLKKGSEQVAITILRSSSTQTFKISPDKNQGVSGTGLDYDTQYTFVFKKDLYDVNGNTLAQDNTITFRTEKSPELQAPTISKIYPKEDSSSAIRNENIRVTFSKELNQNSIDTNIFLKQGSNIIASTKIYKDKIVTINPNVTLSANTLYTVEVLTGLTDTNSKSVEQKIVKSFTTSDEIAIEDTEGNIYKEITSPKTSKVWLDRNLGATKVCDNLNDSNCFGKYYQWSNVSFQTICPTNYEVAKIDDLRNELEGFTRTNLFENFLKLSNNGKMFENKSKDSSSFTYLWSNSDTGSKYSFAKALKVQELYPSIGDESVKNALGIRCIKKGQ